MASVLPSTACTGTVILSDPASLHTPFTNLDKPSSRAALLCLPEKKEDRVVTIRSSTGTLVTGLVLEEIPAADFSNQKKVKQLFSTGRVVWFDVKDGRLGFCNKMKDSLSKILPTNCTYIKRKDDKQQNAFLLGLVIDANKVPSPSIGVDYLTTKSYDSDAKVCESRAQEMEKEAKERKKS